MKEGFINLSVVQNLYQIFKLPASMIVENNCEIENYSQSKGLKDGNVVSIGDNLVFQQLRYLHGDTRDHRELFNYVSKLRNSMHVYKKNGQYKEAHLLQKHINEVLFVKDIVNVVVDKKKSDFHVFRIKGFTLNGVHYSYLCSGSGQIRRNTATFINSKYRDQIVKILNCGLDEKTNEFVLAKYSAYFALAFSSILWVRTPRVCVIKDFYNTLKNQPVDFIYHDDAGKAQIEERRLDLELNCADGQGLIHPDFAKLWAKDMDLCYTPCSFVARSCFIKGNLVSFDFKEYAHINGISTIRDKWGTEYPIDEIDVLISESQFKTSKYYSSWQDYCDYAAKGNIHWGVARYNKKYDEECVLANYQYIQALSLSTDDVKTLITPTIDWIQKICSGETLPTLLYMFGCKSSPIDYQSMMNIAQTPQTRAIVKNVDFLKDSYIQHKIYKNIAETINNAKIGKIWIHGNYQFMIADPLAQCQSALGLEPIGAIKANEIWSKFWIDRFKEQERTGTLPATGHTVDACRSPMIDQHEHNPMTVVVDNENANYWYKHIYSGIIYNIYDTSCFRHEDSDYDGDIVLTTDNEQFIKGSHKEHNIITYEKGLATPAKMTISNITATVMKGFGSGVGGFSNTATILYAMSAIFDKPGYEDQYNEIMRRIKLLREIVGQEIDRIKGADKPSLPQEWKKFEKIVETDTPDQIIAKMKQNAMVVSKKPYFFRYLYPELNQRFKQFEASYNQICRDMFGIKFKKLLKKEDKTEEEKTLIKRYQKYSPLITAPCTMNRLCREFEAVDFDIRFDKKSKSPEGGTSASTTLLPSFADKYESSFSPKRLKIVKNMYVKFSCKKQVAYVESLMQEFSISALSQQQGQQLHSEVRSTVYDDIINSIQNIFEENKFSGEEFLYYCHKLAPQYASFNWGFAWEVLEDQIINFIPQKRTLCPIRDEAGEFEYLGVKYSLQDITPTPLPTPTVSSTPSLGTEDSEEDAEHTTISFNNSEREVNNI